jgi:hypothetical protein
MLTLPLSPNQMVKSSGHRATAHQALLNCSNGHFDLIDDLHEALDLLRQLRLSLESISLPASISSLAIPTTCS